MSTTAFAIPQPVQSDALPKEQQNEKFLNEILSKRVKEIENAGYNKISYVLNSTNCAKNKSITYFNIRVVDNQVQEDINNKIKRNNAFYFSKYSRYNKNNKK